MTSHNKSHNGFTPHSGKTRHLPKLVAISQMAEYPQIGVRVDEEFLKQLDAWRKKQDDVPTRPEAIRRLVELGLKAKR